MSRLSRFFVSQNLRRAPPRATRPNRIWRTAFASMCRSRRARASSRPATRCSNSTTKTLKTTPKTPAASHSRPAIHHHSITTPTAPSRTIHALSLCTPWPCRLRMICQSLWRAAAADPTARRIITYRRRCSGTAQCPREKTRTKPHGCLSSSNRGRSDRLACASFVIRPFHRARLTLFNIILASVFSTTSCVERVK